MQRRFFFLLSSLSAALLYAGCGDDSSGAPPGGAAGSAGGAAAGAGGAPAAPTGLPCAVEQVLRERCQQCHGASTAFGAPMPLVTRDHLLAPSFSDKGVSTAAHVLARMTEGGRPMPPPPNAPATAAELAAIRGWVDAGMPASNEVCTGAGGSGGSGGSGVVMPNNCTPDVVLAAATPYELPQNETDQYVCFSYEMPAGPKRHIIAAAAAIDDTKIVHHLIAFQVPAGEGPGPEPTPCSSVFPPGWKMIYGWGPGGLPLELPAEAGFPTETDAPTRFVVQVHYSNLTREAGHRDQTAINLCSTTQLRPNDADVVAFGGAPFRIPQGEKMRLDCSLDMAMLGGPPVRAFRAWPHMHKLGESFVGQVAHADGTNTPLGAVLDYDFENQISYAVDATITAGDRVTTSCTWNNLDGASDVFFGEETSREMCFNFISYYPRVEIGSALDPAFAATCSQQPP
jgi:copper type II ascorbate-dependent monooxygenase-like protein